MPTFESEEGSWDRVWAAMSAPDTAEFRHGHYDTLTEKERLCVHLLQFLLVGPVEHLDRETRRAVLERLRDLFERNGYKVQYQNIMQVVMSGFSREAHSIIAESMSTFSERAEAEI